MAFDTEIIRVLNKSKNIAISGHISPDGDAIGSSMAMAFCLKKMNKNPIVILDDFNKKLSIIPGAEFLFKGDIKSLSPDTFICLDCTPSERLGVAYEVFNRTKETICIDHHRTNKTLAKYNLVVPTASSTCELVYELIEQLVTLDVNMAIAIYAGLVSDTGGFKYNCTSPQTMRVAAKLMELEIPFSEIYSQIMYLHTFEETKIFSKAIEHMVLLKNLPIAYTYLDKQDLDAFGVTHKNLDGIVEYCLNIVGVEISVFIYELPDNSYKISLRSKKADISGVCVQFGGGGHALAAGFNSNMSRNEIFNETIPLLEEVLK